MSFSQIPWFLLCGGLTVVGLIGSWFVWRRRGARAGARVVAWSLVPIALYLIGIIQPIWNFAYGLVFSPKVWTGLVLLGVAALVFAVTGGLRGSGKSAKKQAGGPAHLAGVILRRGGASREESRFRWREDRKSHDDAPPFGGQP